MKHSAVTLAAFRGHITHARRDERLEIADYTRDTLEQRARGELVVVVRRIVIGVLVLLGLCLFFRGGC